MAGFRYAWNRGAGWQRPASLPSVPAGPYAPLSGYPSIAVFGDSITVGVAASAAGNRWAGLVAAGCGASLANAGQSGTVLQHSADAGGSPRAGNGRDRFAADLLGSNRKAAVFIAYGFNDARYTAAPATFNADRYRVDLRELLNGLVTGGYAAEDIHVGTPYYITDAGLQSGSTGFTGQSRAGFEAYVAAALEVAAEYGTRACDLYAYLRDNGFAATLDSDNIHPLNAGHALIAQAWQTRTLRAGTRPRPASVAASASNGRVETSCTAVPGASGYEFTLVRNHADAATAGGEQPAAGFADVAAGTVHIKARAILGAARSAWQFSAPVQVAGATGGTGGGSAIVFVRDTFAGTAETALTAHAPDLGGAWQLQSGNTTNAAPRLDGAGGIYVFTNGTYRNLATPPAADYAVEATLVFRSAVASDTVGVAARMQPGANTLYFARWQASGSAWQLYRTVAGTSTLLASVGGSFTGGTRRMRFEVRGTSLSLAVDGAPILSATDAAIVDAGCAGIRSTASTNQTASTGIHLTDFVAATL